MAEFDTILTGTTIVAFLSTVALAFVMPRLRRADPRAAAPDMRPYIPTDVPELPVEHDDPDWRECVAVSRHIADLMIADEWIEIADRITDWEAALAASPGGTRYHEIAVKTCLSGLQGLIDDMPGTALSDLDDAEVEVGHFADTHRQMPDNHILALLAARAHVAVGIACNEGAWTGDDRRNALRRAARHYIAAGEILAPFDAVAYMSPLLAEARYLQALGTPGRENVLKRLFEEWIDLDPSNSNIYATHVAAMVARDRITGDDILREADRAMRRTEDTLGFGGYALFFMPLLTEYDTARRLLDPELYAVALMDLASHSATQVEVNLYAAAMLTESEASDECLSAAFRDSLTLIIRQRLEVIYPRVWPISAEEIQDLVAEAAHALPDLDLDEDGERIAPTRPVDIAA